MKFTETSLKGVYVIDLEPFGDSRGTFMRTFCKREFAVIGHMKEFVQMNHSVNKQRGTVRGLHYQVSPSYEIKLIRCIRGGVLDVVLDLRKDSPTYLQWTGVELSADNRKMIYIPEGCAHGFQTIEDDTELLYHHTMYYSSADERGIRYNDPCVNVSFPLPVAAISEKDLSHPLLDDNFEGVTA
jgi:dTDP-4-dehydrorhamnose 3,5-epimerase